MSAVRAAIVALGFVVSGCGGPLGPEDPPVDCADPVAGCVLPNGASLRLSERPRPLHPFRISLLDVSSGVKAVAVEARMDGMAMPPVGTRMASPAANAWTGELTLPVCSAGRSDWELWLTIGAQQMRVRVQAERR